MSFPAFRRGQHRAYDIIETHLDGRHETHLKLFVLKALCDGKTSVERVLVLDRRNGRHELVQGLELSKGPPRNVEDTAVLFQHLFVIIRHVALSGGRREQECFTPRVSKKTYREADAELGRGFRNRQVEDRLDRVLRDRDAPVFSRRVSFRLFAGAQEADKIFRDIVQAHRARAAVLRYYGASQGAGHDRNDRFFFDCLSLNDEIIGRLPDDCLFLGFHASHSSSARSHGLECENCGE